MYTIYLCDCQPYGECPCPWNDCSDCKKTPDIIINKEDDQNG